MIALRSAFIQEEIMPSSSWPDSVKIIDTHYIKEENAAVYLLIEGDRAAFIDTNTTRSVPRLLTALQENGLTPEQVDYLIVTHVHLDHAGGTEALLEHCPNATVLAHPKAARHLAAPERLIAGTRMVYGDELYEELYGNIQPVPADRIRAMEDDEELTWKSRRLRFFYTYGHATHHFCIHDLATNCLFTGDALGIGRSHFQRPGPQFVHVSTSPPEFSAKDARAAAEAIRATNADFAFIAHYGVIDNVPLAVDQLLASLDRMEAICIAAAESDLPDHELNAFCIERVGPAFDEHFLACDVSDIDRDRACTQGDQLLNGMGLAIAAQRMRKERK